MDVFAALADPVRRSILRTLAGGPVRVVDLAAQQDVTRPAVSKHLRVLTGLGLVTAEPRGRETLYRLRPAPLAEVRDLLDALEGPVPTASLGPGPVVTESRLAALDTEVRRTTRDRRAARATTPPPDDLTRRAGPAGAHPTEEIA